MSSGDIIASVCLSLVAALSNVDEDTGMITFLVTALLIGVLVEMIVNRQPQSRPYVWIILFASKALNRTIRESVKQCCK